MPRHQLDVWALMRVYVATFDIIVEANLQLPFAIMDEWARLTRA